MNFSRIGVVGSGIMGGGIAQVAAVSGIDVTVVDVDADRVNAGLDAVRRRLGREVERGRLPRETADEAVERLHAGSDMDSLRSLSHCDAVIEAVVEDLDVKSAVFRTLGKACGPD